MNTLDHVSKDAVLVDFMIFSRCELILELIIAYIFAAILFFDQTFVFINI